MVDNNVHSEDDIVIEGGPDTDENDLEIEEHEELSAAKVKQLREKLKSCEKEKQEHLDGWQRSRADFLNYKRRMEEDAKRGADMASVRFIESLVPLLDSFTLATQGTAWNEADPKFKSGFEMIQNQLTSILRDHKVERFDPTGEQFDPRYHEAISERNEEGKSGVIIETIQPGYKMGDTILRAARVVVGT